MMMDSDDEAWRKIMIVKDIPDDWSKDMLENYIEVVTKAELASDGIHHFCDVRDTVLLTFSEVLTEQHVRNAELETKVKGRTLKFLRIEEAPRSILVKNLPPGLTHDNLLFYFDSKRSGGEEGGVEETENGDGVEMFEKFKMAVVTFVSTEVTHKVLKMAVHSPSKGNEVLVEPCYEDFHRYILCTLSERMFRPFGHGQQKTGDQEQDIESELHTSSPLGPENLRKEKGGRYRPFQHCVVEQEQIQTETEPRHHQTSVAPTKTFLNSPEYKNIDSVGDCEDREMRDSDAYCEGADCSVSSKGNYRQGGKRNRRKRNKGKKDQNQKEMVRDNVGQTDSQWDNLHQSHLGGDYRGYHRGRFRPPSPRSDYRGRGHGQGGSPLWQAQAETQNATCNEKNQRGSYNNPSDRFRGRGGWRGRRGGRGRRGQWISSPAAAEDMHHYEPPRNSYSVSCGLDDYSLPSDQGSSVRAKPAAAFQRLLKFDADLTPIACEDPAPVNNSAGLEMQSYDHDTYELDVDRDMKSLSLPSPTSQSGQRHPQYSGQDFIEPAKRSGHVASAKPEKSLKTDSSSKEIVPAPVHFLVKMHAGKNVPKISTSLHNKNMEDDSENRLRMQHSGQDSLRKDVPQQNRFLALNVDRLDTEQLENEEGLIFTEDVENKKAQKETEQQKTEEYERHKAEIEQLHQQQKTAEKNWKRKLQEEKQKLEEEMKKQLEVEKQRFIQEKKQVEEKAEKFHEEHQSLQQELAKWKHETWREKCPSYKLRLLKNRRFGSDFLTCSVIIHEEEGTIEIKGPTEELPNIKLSFYKEMQGLFEKSQSISSAIVSILHTSNGRLYLDQLCPDQEFSYEVQDSEIICAAYQETDIDCFQDALMRNIDERKFDASGVPKSQLAELKVRLEDDYPLVRVTLPSGGSDDIIVEGLNGDVDLALREVRNHCSQNKLEQHTFHLLSPLQARACKLWCDRELDEIKTTVWKSEGEVVKEDYSSGYKLIYRCTSDLQKQIGPRLSALRNKVGNVFDIDLETSVQSHTARVLINNGLKNEGVQAMSSFLEEKLQVEGWNVVLSFNIAQNLSIPSLKYKSTRLRPKFVPKPLPRASRRSRHSTSSITPHSAKFKNGTVTVKSGNIVEEKVEGLVVVVGEDMDLHKTAVGQSLLKSYPSIAASIPSKGAPGQVYPVQDSNRKVFLAVLSEAMQPMTIAAVMQRCLQIAAAQSVKSLAVPPLGCGRRFKVPLDHVADVMAKTSKQFFEDNNTTTKEVYIVVYDKDEARKFRKTLKTIEKPPLPAILSFFPTKVESDSENDVDADDDFDLDDYDTKVIRTAAQGSAAANQNADSDDEDEELDFFSASDDEGKDKATPVPVPVPSKYGQIIFCQQSCSDQQSLNSVKTSLLRLLKSRFVHEVAQDMHLFKKLGSRAVEDIKSFATRVFVALKVESRGSKETLLLRGTAESVGKVVVKVNEAIAAYTAKLQRGEHQMLRERGLPTAADRMKLPDYWTICQKGIFKGLEQFIRDYQKFGKLYTLSGNEVDEVKDLINKTWDQRLVGHGADAKNLVHRNIQLVKLERLENPNLWEMYCTHRDRLMRRAQTMGAFTTVDRVKGSSGTVKTTLNINPKGSLGREIYPQVNEHYMFHGTKKQYIEAIIEQGLDCRIANAGAMLGRGIYASECSTKADQYTDVKAQRTSGHKTMLLMRVLLGEPFINKSINPPKYDRPPCKKCYKDHQGCQCRGSELFDSVIDDATRNFREFVVYDRCMCYPEYFITYARV